MVEIAQMDKLNLNIARNHFLHKHHFVFKEFIKAAFIDSEENFFETF